MFKNDAATLQPFITDALKQKELQDGVRHAGTDEEYLQAELEKRAETIWKAAKEKETVSTYNKDSEAFRHDLERLEESARPSQSTVKRLEKVAAVAVAVIVVLGFAVGIPLSRVGYDETYAFLMRYPAVLVPGFFIALAAVFAYVLASIAKSARASDVRKLTAALAETEGKLKELRVKAEADILSAVTEEGRAVLARLMDSYSTVLCVDRAPGLAELSINSYAVNTEAKQKLELMLKYMPGGSIGIAGPRGAGKTTLMRAYCEAPVTGLDDHHVLEVMTSAPVEYDPRDFILYLFQQVCTRVLEEFKLRPNAAPWGQGDAGGSFSPRAYSNALVLAGVLTAAGLALVLAAFLIVPLKESAGAKATPAASPAATPAPETAAPQPGAAERYVQAFKLEPGTLLWWGAFLTLPGLALLYLCFFRWRRQPRPAPKLPIWMTKEPPYIEEAWGWLKSIKFQQSYTEGWSGALKLPVGLESGLNRAVSMAEKQKSLPEIVGGLRSFIKSVAEDFRVVVGIDELDKIESDEKAQQFVNQMKSIFGIRNCFYLVSVSESAMSNFERRGIPFRDAFDSSFDSILHVDYLTLDAAKRVITRRVIGMSVPFQCLCYCASGGLARDLIRTCRAIVDLGRDREDGAPVKDFDPLCRMLAKSDIKSKIRAVSTSAQKVELGAETEAFLGDLVRLESAVDAGDDLLPACERLRVKLERRLISDKDEAKEEASLLVERAKLASLGEELATYVYYWDTLLHFFADTLAKGNLREREGSGVINTFARARQMLGVRPAITRTILLHYRDSCGLPVLNFGAEAQAAGDVAVAANGNGAAALKV